MLNDSYRLLNGFYFIFDDFFVSSPRFFLKKRGDTACARPSERGSVGHLCVCTAVRGGRRGYLCVHTAVRGGSGGHFMRTRCRQREEAGAFMRERCRQREEAGVRNSTSGKLPSEGGGVGRGRCGFGLADGLFFLFPLHKAVGDGRVLPFFKNNFEAAFG